MIIVQIMSRWDSKKVIFQCGIPDETPKDQQKKLALKMAITAKADLRGSDLRGSDLRDSDLRQWATPHQAIENLDKVRAIILDQEDRLQMDHWHGSSEWVKNTCAEEAVCGTTHCLAGWLQVCSTDPKIRGLDAHLAGMVSAPIAKKMFFRDGGAVIDWLESRAYVAETEKREQRGKELAERRLAAKTFTTN